MRFPALLSVLAAVALWPVSAVAACDAAAPCVDAEPMWLAPGSRYWTFIGSTGALGWGELAASATAGFRLSPVVLVAPAPSAAGREINLIRHTTDLTAGVRVGVGNRMELMLSLPAGLYQRGAGINSVTHQSAPPISEQSLHDPRVGFGYALPYRPFKRIFLKLQLELKLPLGDQAALMGEESFVASPTLILGTKAGRWFSAGALGFRLRRPSDFFGRRVGTQELAAVGLGYELPRPQLAFTLEAYAVPSLQPASNPDAALDFPAEWLASVRYTPHGVQNLSFGVGGGTAIPAPHGDAGWQSGIGAPLLRVLAFARWVPPSR